MVYKPMLAATTDGTGLRYPLLASPKLDGIRAIIVDGVVMSRNIKPIPNNHVQKLFGKSKFNGLDGELIVGQPHDKNCFRKTSSGVMAELGEPDVWFYVFDHTVFHVDARPFTERFEYLKKSPHLVRAAADKVLWVGHTFMKDEEELINYEAECLEQGYEGVMLRDPMGLYKYGRSTSREHGLMKLKRFEDSEAEIISMVERMHNANEKTIDELGRSKRSSHRANKHGTGVMGALNVRDIHSGVEFDIGTGFDDTQRKWFWEAEIKQFEGKIVKYKYFPTGSKDKPRFPVFLGFRDPIDV